MSDFKVKMHQIRFPLGLRPRPHSLPLEVGPLNTARGLGERCKLPQRGLGQSPSGVWSAAPAEIEFGAC